MIRKRLTLPVLFIVAAISVACGDDDSPTGPSGSGGAVGEIQNNHGHTAIVTAQQLADGRQITLDMRGSADHSHSLEISDDNMRRLQRRERVEVDSTLQNGHRHRVNFN